MTALATASDVSAALLRDLTDVEAANVDRLASRIERRIRRRIPDLAARVAADADYKATVVDVEAEAVARVYRNPNGMKQESDGTYSYSVDALVASGILKVTDSDWDELGEYSPVQSLAPAMDGYAQARYGGNPALQFQNAWPATTSMSERIE